MKIAPILLALSVALLPIATAHAAKTVTKSNSTKSAAHKKLSHPRAATPTRVQPTVLRYTGLRSLPRQMQNEFNRPQTPTSTTEANTATPIDTGDAAESRCARSALGSPSTPNNKVSPCLGLYQLTEAPSPVKFLFDVALKSVGAPKDVFITQCQTGAHHALCNSPLGQATNEQERLADTLNRQRRTPVASMGVAISF